VLQLVDELSLPFPIFICPAPVPISASHLPNMDSVLIDEVFDEVLYGRGVDAHNRGQIILTTI
jgi:hypothetical protein